MNEDAGRELLAAIEALHVELREMRKEVQQDREVREALDQRRKSDAERQARRRSQNMSRDSRDNHVTSGSVVLDLNTRDQKQELKIPASRDNHAASRDTRPTWESYSKAYESRHGAKPVRNATVNGQMARFVKRVGVEEAPAVAEFYVGHNAAWYVGKMHPVGLLLSDAEKLRTEWATGRRTTATAARQADKTQTNMDGWDALRRSNGVD